MTDGYVLLLNPSLLPDDLAQRVRDSAGVPVVEAACRTFGIMSPAEEVRDYVHSLLSKHPKALGVAHSTGYSHHMDYGFGLEFARRADRPPHILFTDAHTDDYMNSDGSRIRSGGSPPQQKIAARRGGTGQAIPSGSGIQYASFSHLLYREISADGITFAAPNSSASSRRAVAAYSGNDRYVSPSTVSSGKPLPLPDRPIISINDLDCLSRYDILSSWPSKPRHPVGARALANWLADSLSDRELAGFTVLGYDKSPRDEDGESVRYYCDGAAKRRSAYSYAAVIAALAGNPDRIDPIMDEADRKFPIPEDAYSGPGLLARLMDLFD